MTAREVAFLAVCVPVVLAAFGAVRSRQLIHAAFWLVLSLASLAGVYLVMGAELVALVQVLVYVGAVVVLMLFALMLTKAPIGKSDELDLSPRRRRLAAAAGLAVAVGLGALLITTIGGRSVAVVPQAGQAAAIGQSLFTDWVLPFELLSLLLLAALVGAIAISRRRDHQ